MGLLGGQRDWICVELADVPLPKRAAVEILGISSYPKRQAGQPVLPSVACAVCGEPVGQIRVRDEEGKPVQLCVNCDWMMDWQ